jgi:hypothetical protein
MATDNAAQLRVLNDELESWRVKGEKALNTLEGLGDDADEETRSGAQEAYDHCYAKHEEIAWQIDRLENPQNYG